MKPFATPIYKGVFYGGMLLLAGPLAVMSPVDNADLQAAPLKKPIEKRFANWVFEAEEAYASGDFRQAESLFSNALQSFARGKSDPTKLPTIHFFLANINIELGDDAAANRHYQRSLSLENDSPSTYAYYAHAKLHSKEYDVAEALYKKALELASDYWVCYEGLGHVHFHQGDALKSAEMFENALRLHSSHPKRVSIELIIKRLREQHEERLRREEAERKRKEEEEAKRKEIDKGRLQLGRSAKPKSEESIKDVEPELDIID